MFKERSNLRKEPMNQQDELIAGMFQKKKTQDWEKEFDKQDFCWTDTAINKRRLHKNRDITDEVKSFIRTLLEQKEKEAFNKGWQEAQAMFRKGV